MLHSTCSEKRDKIAIIGMSGRFPGAHNIETFWSNIINGVDSIRFFEKEELLKEKYIDPALINHSNFIPAKGYLDNAEYFAAEFFKFSTNKAKLLDPQLRILLECVWEAWENAGYNIKQYQGIVGTYITSSSYDSYWHQNILKNDQFNNNLYDYEAFISNAKDFLSTQIAYQFDFKGPALNIQTACSSSLVAICQACDDLLNNKCDIAVTGAMCITFPLKNGYLYKEGMIYSKDGRCCAFSKDASGIVPGNGGGVILLKRLSQAEQDGDHIFAAISGYAINNDGHDKLSFTAPSISGQYEVLLAAAQAGSIDPNTIGYIEAHGSGTALGDQIEIEALKQHITSNVGRTSPCYLGSVKTNIGHLDVAAGMAGFIKTVLSLYHKKIPKSLHAEIINPNLKLRESMLQIANKTIDWETNEAYPRRAGVSSFGVGGTNAHMILEERLARANQHMHYENTEDDIWHILPLSAKTQVELEEKKDQLAMFMRNAKQCNLADIAYTLQVGRANFPKRLTVICRNKEEAFDALYLPDSDKLFQNEHISFPARIAFLFPDSLDTESLEIIMQLYSSIKIFSDIVDCCKDTALEILGYNSLCNLIAYISNKQSFFEYSYLERSILIFIVEYAFAKCLMAWGVTPEILVGYGVGEFAAACLAEVFSVSDAIRLIALYSEILTPNHRNIVLSVSLSENDLNEILKDEKINIIAINAPLNCYIAIDERSLEEVERKLLQNEVVYERLYNCLQMNSIIKPDGQLLNLIEEIKFNNPKIAIARTSYNNLPLSNNFEPAYWLNKISSSILYANVISALLSTKVNMFMEIGPGEQLCRWVQQINYSNLKEEIIVTPVLPLRSREKITESLSKALAKTWLAGAAINWEIWLSTKRLLGNYKKICLPTYPFTRHAYFIEPQSIGIKHSLENYAPGEIDHELYLADWRQQQKPSVLSEAKIAGIVLLENPLGIARKVMESFCKENNIAQQLFVPYIEEQYLEKIISEEWLISRTSIWRERISQHAKNTSIYILIDDYPDSTQSFYELMALAKALGSIRDNVSIKLYIFTSGIAKIKQTDSLVHERAMLLGPILCLPLEHPNLAAKCIDIDFKENSACLVSKCAEELQIFDHSNFVALRGNERYIRYYPPLNSNSSSHLKFPSIRFKKNGVYLITGGLGGIGLVLAGYLAKFFAANLILISRLALPDKAEWIDSLTNRGVSITLAHKLSSLLEIEKEANQLMIFSADVADYESMKNIISQIKNRFGHIDGVIHAASVAPERMLQHKTIYDAENMFRAKILGLKVLNRLLCHENLDFMLLFSSLNTLFGAAGAADYVSANTYLNMFANQNNECYPIISINWDTWKDTGMRHDYFFKRAFQNANAYGLGYGKWRTFLVEHKVDLRMVLLGSLLLEICLIEFERKFNRASILAINQISFLMPGIVNNLDEFKIYSSIDDSNRVEFKTNEHILGKTIFRATLEQEAPSILSPIDVYSLLERFKSVDTLQNENVRYTKTGRIDVGPHWDCLMWAKKYNTTYLAKISLPESFKTELGNFHLHPSLFDVGYAFHGQFMNKLHLPYYIENFMVFSSLPKTFYSLVEVKSINTATGICLSDVTMFDEKGNIHISIKGFILKEATNVVEESSYNNEKHVEIKGLNKLEGIAILNRIMHCPYSEVIVSKEKISDKCQANPETPLLEVLDQSNDFAIEQTGNFSEMVRSIWMKLLGIKAVSNQDNFFDLNGDSLLAIEICYAIKTKTGVNVNPNILLEYPIFSDFVSVISIEMAE